VTSPSSTRETRGGRRARALASPVARRFRTRHERVLFRHASASFLLAAEIRAFEFFPFKVLTNSLSPRLAPPGFIPYSGDGYAFLLPSKYHPTRERPFPNCDAYFEDNFDAVSNISVLVEKVGKSKIEDFGSPEAYLEQIGYLLGQQVYAGETRSEGGFAANRVSTAAVLDVFTKSNKGKTYYYYEVLTRTADGDEGGRHQLIATTVSDGVLYTCKLQSGDKRWFKGQERDLKQTWSSFTVA
jgi:hypothetical protein